MAELNHRVKNTLATVRSIASQTLGQANSPEEFREAFTGRLAALAQAHELLIRTHWYSADLPGASYRALPPFVPPAPAPSLLASPPFRLQPTLPLFLLSLFLPFFFSFFFSFFSFFSLFLF